MPAAMLTSAMVSQMNSQADMQAHAWACVSNHTYTRLTGRVSTNKSPVPNDMQRDEFCTTTTHATTPQHGHQTHREHHVMHNARQQTNNDANHKPKQVQTHRIQYKLLISLPHTTHVSDLQPMVTTSAPTQKPTFA